MTCCILLIRVPRTSQIKLQREGDKICKQKFPTYLLREYLNIVLNNLIQVISWKCSGNKKCINALDDLRAKCLQPGYGSSYDEGVYVMSSFISIHCLEIHNVSYHMVLICNTISTQHISAFTCNLQGLKNKNCVTLLVAAITTIYVKHYWKNLHNEF